MKQLSETGLENNSIDEKLYVPRYVEGEKNEKFFEILRLVETKLSPFPNFIGIAPYGSQTKGYSDEGSDIDIKIFYSNFTEDDTRVIETVFDDIKKQYNIEVHPHVKSVNIKSLENTFNDVGLIYYAADTLKDVSRLSIGPGIDVLRQNIREILETVHPEIKERIFIKALGNIEEEETISGRKITERLTHDNEATKNIVEKRMELWRERFLKLWGYLPEF